MFAHLISLVLSLRLAAATRRDLLFEIAALRQQLAVLQRAGIKPRFRRGDRRFWIWLSSRWPAWREGVVIMRPETVIRWHRRGYQVFWRWRSRGRVGRPRIPRCHMAFIRKISSENPAWGEDRIALELRLKLGVDHSASTIRRYMVDSGRPSSTWRSFLANHAGQIYALDFTKQVMWDFSVCTVLVIIDHRTRELVQIGVTRHPSLTWVKQQIRDACPWDGPRFLIHDNDGIFGRLGPKSGYRSTLDAWLHTVMQIRGIPTPYGAPNANAICERVIGTLRRECMNHFIFVSEQHLRESLAEYRVYYNEARPHQGIEGIPGELNEPRAPPKDGQTRLVGKAVLGGLHHDYRLAA